MSKNFLNITLVAFIFILTSCGVSKRFAETRIGSRPQICLQDNNFRVIKTVKGEHTVTSFLGIGKEQRKYALDHAIQKMYVEADLKGSQAIVDIIPTMTIKEDYLFVRKWSIEVVGRVIEFTDEIVKSHSEAQGIVLPIVRTVQAGQKEPSFNEIVTSTGASPVTAPVETSTTVPVQDTVTIPTVKIETSAKTETSEPVVPEKTPIVKERTKEFEETVEEEVKELSPSELRTMRREARKSIKRVNLDKINTREDYEEAMLNLDIAEEYNTYVKDEDLAHQIKRMRQYLEVRESIYL